MGRWSRAIEWTANTLTVLAAIVVIGTMVKSYVTAEQVAGAQALPSSTSVGLSNVDWAGRDATVVLALSVGCQYCTQSAPFYRELLAASAGHQIRLIAAFPQSPSEAAAYLRLVQVGFSDVRQVQFSELKVRGTPTLMIVDPHGRLAAGWVGALSEQQEEQVFRRLGLTRQKGARTAPQSRAPAEQRSDAIAPDAKSTGLGRAGSAEAADANEYVEFRRRNGEQPVVDIRERDAFAKGHIKEAVNIPLSELETRASHELPRRRPVFVYCRYSASCEGDAKAQGVVTYCAIAAQALASAGVSGAKPIIGDLHELHNAGIDITGDLDEK